MLCHRNSRVILEVISSGVSVRYDICLIFDWTGYRSLRSIWDDVISPFNTISYIYINSQKATKTWFDSWRYYFINGLSVVFNKNKSLLENSWARTQTNFKIKACLISAQVWPHLYPLHVHTYEPCMFEGTDICGLNWSLVLLSRLIYDQTV